ncbi:hypothetical protein LHJ74_18645 [Streptomyces sp. N2-109]|uniref:Integral membrane protein n=1 Tax=Streptomyces gossypii TaxID=2883101 RepID=A0ABT2JVH6_9ACTN|nr:hypothetical protein [Streptomyces gossypii]MCT2591893.1 hypothetical protein [Streptomyces gossypii]
MSDGPEREPNPPRPAADRPSGDRTPAGPGAVDLAGWAGVGAGAGLGSVDEGVSGEPLDRGEAGERVIWPEAGQANDVAALDASRVPAVEQTGPVRTRAGAGSRPWPVAGRVSARAQAASPIWLAARTGRSAGTAGRAGTAEADADAAAAASGPLSAPSPEAGRVEGSADPVRQLMCRYRELCERAVDSLEIAAGLEARGITDRTAAARFRHRDVFSLAEELYARVPHAEDAPVAPVSGTSSAPGLVDPVGLDESFAWDVPSSDPGAPGRARRVRAAAPLVAAPLLPGVVCTAVFGAFAYLPSQAPAAVRVGVGAVGAVAVLAAVRPALRPVLRSSRPDGTGTRGLMLSVCLLLAYALYGDWLLTALLSGGPGPDAFTPVAARPGVPLALAYAVVPAAWCAHLFAVRSRRRLEGSRSLDHFASRARPLLGASAALFLLALAGLHGAAALILDGRYPAAGTHSATTALGVLLFVSLLLSAHGFPGAALAGPAAAVAVQAAALGSVLSARLPGLGGLGRPVERSVSALGTAVVPASACAVAALALLGYAWRALAGASAHYLRTEH